MATRKEEKERLRAARLEAERREAQAARKRLILGYGVAGVLTAAVLVGIVVVIASGGGGSGGDTPAAAHIDTATGSINGVAPDAREGTAPPAVAEPRPGERGRRGRLRPAAQPARRGRHPPRAGLQSPRTTAPTRRPRATTSPPRSSRPTAPTLETPELIQFVHSLEHGRIEIQYAPDLPEADQLALKGVFDESPSGMLLFPNREMPYEVAATAWTQLMGCKRYEGAKTLDAIRDFRDHVPRPGARGQVPYHPMSADRRSLARRSSSSSLLDRRSRQGGGDRRPEHDQHRQRVQRPEVPVGDVCERYGASGRFVGEPAARSGAGRLGQPRRAGRTPESCAAVAEPPVGVRVADDLVRVEGELARWRSRA